MATVRTVNINRNESAGTVTVQAPYHEGFVGKARNMGGKWQSPFWVFDIRNEDLVRQACINCYGTDGQGVIDTVTLKVSLDSGYYRLKSAITLCGRTIARAFDRDSGARLGDGIVLLTGGFFSSGSMKNWATEVSADGATVLIHDFPKIRVEDAKNESEYITILDVIDEKKNIDIASLAEEKNRLLARIAEIDQMVASLGTTCPDCYDKFSDA